MAIAKRRRGQVGMARGKFIGRMDGLATLTVGKHATILPVPAFLVVRHNRIAGRPLRAPIIIRVHIYTYV